MFSILRKITFLSGIAVSCGFGKPSVTLTASLPSPQPVGTRIEFTATASDTSAGSLDYRYSVAPAGGSATVASDYYLYPGFEWTTGLTEGSFTITVMARNRTTGEKGTASANFTVTPIAGASTGVITPTVSPLVALYSAPACKPSATIQFRFWKDGTQPSSGTLTPQQSCGAGVTNNIYIAGMLPSTKYWIRHEVKDGVNTQAGTPIAFTTGTIPATMPGQGALLGGPTMATAQPVVIQSLISTPEGPSFPVATDLRGNILWYYPRLADPNMPATSLMRMLTGGTMLVLSHDPNNPNPYTNRAQMLAEVDLAGNILRQTNATRISEQVQALGGPDRITQLHHDAIRLANGHTMVLGFAERLYPPGTQGSMTGMPVDVLGIYAIDMDQNLQVTWFWSSFDHMDVNRAAILGEVCTSTASLCPPLYLATKANDWMHANTLNYVPGDGSLLISLRNQDWVIKVNYANGTGDGTVLWRLGAGGDFTIQSTDPSPWFSHQHDARLVPGASLLTLYDNGNTRKASNPLATSRGQALALDEVNRIATTVVNADMGVYSHALGSAQQLVNGDYAFVSGWVQTQSGQTLARFPETTADGSAMVYQLQNNQITYRGFRQASMYQE